MFDYETLFLTQTYYHSPVHSLENVAVVGFLSILWIHLCDWERTGLVTGIPHTDAKGKVSAIDLSAVPPRC